MTFEIEITRFEEGFLSRRATAGDADAAEAMVRAGVRGECCVRATQRDGDRLGEDFYVWFAGDRALVRRDEHREWYAADPAVAGSAAGATVEFRDDDGSRFPERMVGTVSRAQALEALACWLRTGTLLPSLTWR